VPQIGASEPSVMEGEAAALLGQIAGDRQRVGGNTAVEAN